MRSDRQYPIGKILENKFFGASNSFHFISSVAFDFEYTPYDNSTLGLLTEPFVIVIPLHGHVSWFKLFDFRMN